MTLRLGDDELVIRQRYAAAGILNDVMLVVWFVVGGVFFFFPSLVTVGLWCFVAGSVQLLIRPLIRLIRRSHLRRLRRGGTGPTKHNRGS
ncbi:MAG TPA: YrhK family protein [Nocardioidaceae bacterium]|nr:YrhK family protein [Nocardioidaceae bacterium]